METKIRVLMVRRWFIWRVVVWIEEAGEHFGQSVTSLPILSALTLSQHVADAKALLFAERLEEELTIQKLNDPGTVREFTAAEIAAAFHPN